ncbi:MAG: PIN domain-containing protein [Intrasporangium sp.]|uniref:TA system VapC family ribonuclease toxin n=1 Tax=Intrasporangium sp. TaxID=1925024 RepID=UPI00264768C8|nr:TA system VapC family ribonuclease toxin [Intrasporangium sp.]MDN5797575.1 PIN domain-containing protein [Intrasporangium sp.]
MHVVDANVLLYAVNSDSVHHEDARAWLDEALAGRATVLFDWSVILAFVRLATMRRIFENPLTPREATDQVSAWLTQPGAEIVSPSADHLDRVTALLSEARTGGNLVGDAHLAALALEARGLLVSFDSDFDRFAGVRRLQPHGWV